MSAVSQVLRQEIFHDQPLPMPRTGWGQHDPKTWNETKMNKKMKVYVVVQFCPWFKFYSPLFLAMVICDNEFETKEEKLNQGLN